MTKTDHAALRLVVEKYRRQFGDAYVDSMIEDRGWEGAAKFFAHCQQGGNLKLHPWQIPPADIVDPDNPDEGLRQKEFDDGRREAAALLKRMLALDISRWASDPLGEIAAAERKAAS